MKTNDLKNRLQRLEGKITNRAQANKLHAEITAELGGRFPGLAINTDIPADFDIEAWRKERAGRLQEIAAIPEPDAYRT